MMEILFEFFMELWGELAMLSLPKSLQRSKRAEHICRLVILFLILYVIVALPAGAIMLADAIGSRALAIFLFASSLSILVLQITLGVVFYPKKRKK
ncbi:MAG: hypothetical protein IJY65_00350 [Clostridia bacterium]|nr:hypothetical protein [Clostridia bacterium]